MADVSQLTDEQRKELEEKLKKMSPEEIAEMQKKQCIFCQIISGKIHSKKIFENEDTVAVLDINPAAKGHILIFPKEHYVIMPQVPANVLSRLFIISKMLSQVLLKVLKVQGTNLFVANGLAAGQRAQHFMIHLIPRKDGDKIMEIDEKIIDKDTLRKVKIAVENKLNEVFGVNKKVVLADEYSIEEFSVDKNAADKEVKEEHEDKKQKKIVNTESKTKKAPVKRKVSEKKDQEEKSVNLDDIANLFT